VHRVSSSLDQARVTDLAEAVGSDASATDDVGIASMRKRPRATI
jgi:hypothetical protein